MTNSPSLFLKVEVTAGCDIERAAAEGAALANRVGVWVEFDFNDVSCHLAPGCDPADLVEEWKAIAFAKRPHKMAFARPGGNHRYSVGKNEQREGK